MQKGIISILIALTFFLVLSTIPAALANDTRILVSVEEDDNFTIEQNGLHILPGEDAIFTLKLKRGIALTGTDYPGDTEIHSEDSNTILTLRTVSYPTRVKLSLTTKYCTVTYEGNGGVTPEGLTEIEKRYSLSTHSRPNTENGQNLFLRPGFTLIGWNTRSDGTGERIGLGSRVTPMNGKAKLYAQWAQWSNEADFTWAGEDQAVITGYHGHEKTIVIPEMLGNLPVYTIAKDAFTDTVADEIILSPSIRRVENGAFQHCNLSTLTLFDTIESIEDKAFADCSDLSTLRINAAEAPYGYVYRKESVYADKIELLLKAQGRKKLVFYGGCSTWYNLDAIQMDRRFGEEYAIINMGLNGTASSAVQLQIMASFLKEGDILFHTPELSSPQQMMTETTMGNNDSSLWAGLENNYDLFSLVDLRLIQGAFTSLTHYLSLKDKRTDYQQFYSDDYRTPYIDAYGSIPFYRSSTQRNLETTDQVRLDPFMVSPDKLQNLKESYDWLSAKGIQIIVSYACINMDALPEEQHDYVEATDNAFRNTIQSMQGPAMISSLSDYLFHNADFYDTNYHLCSEPAKHNTSQWLSDLDAFLKNE